MSCLELHQAALGLLQFNDESLLAVLQGLEAFFLLFPLPPVALQQPYNMRCHSNQVSVTAGTVVSPMNIKPTLQYAPCCHSNQQLYMEHNVAIATTEETDMKSWIKETLHATVNMCPLCHSDLSTPYLMTNANLSVHLSILSVRPSVRHPPSAVLSSIASSSLARPSSPSLSSNSSHRSVKVATSTSRSSSVAARWFCRCCVSWSCCDVSRTMSRRRSTAAWRRLPASVTP